MDIFEYKIPEKTLVIMMTVVHVIISLVEGPQKTGVGQAAASRESSPPYRHVGPARNSQGGFTRFDAKQDSTQTFST